MIKINLALKKQSGLAAAATQKKSFLPKFSGDASGLRRLLVPAMMCVVATIVADSVKSEELSKVEVEVQKRQSEKAKLAADLEKFKGVEQLKVQLEADELLLRNKIAALTLLQKDRPETFHMLRGLSETIPADTWLTSFKIESRNVQLQGSALQYPSISDFMRRLNETPYFGEVALKSSKQDNTNSGATGLQSRAIFELDLKKKLGGGT